MVSEGFRILYILIRDLVSHLELIVLNNFITVNLSTNVEHA